MTTVWNLTFAEFAARVLQKCGVLAAGETASADDLALAADVIDGALKALHADGLLWWAVTTSEIAWSGASDGSILDSAEILFAYWLDGTYRPVRVVERQEWEAIEDKTQTGTPELLFDDGGTLRVWPAPTSGTMRVTYQREISDTGMGSNLDMPKKLVKPMVDLMAYEIAPYFGVVNPRLDADAQRATLTLRKLSRQSAQPGVVEAEYY